MLINEKIDQAKKLLKEFDIDCWITFTRESQINGDPVLCFLTNSAVTWHSAFIITKKGKSHAIVGKYDKKSIEDLGAYDSVEEFVEDFKKPLQAYLKQIDPWKIAINYSIDSEICDGLTHGMFLTLFLLLREIGMEKRLVSAEKIVSALRERKSQLEIDYIKSAIKHTEDIFSKVAKFIKPGKTEQQIASFMKDEVKKKRLEYAWNENSCPSVFTGPDTAEAHYEPTSKKVKRGHVLNMDFGVKYNGYCSDLQRTFYILENGEKKAPKDVQKGFDTIVEAVDISKSALMCGVQGIEVDVIAREILLAKGYDEFPHALGHQVGRYAHDGTVLLGPAWEKYAQKPFKKTEPNMVFTIEPRLNVPDRGIVTIEEMVRVTEKDSEYLSTPQKKLILIK